MGLQVRVLFDPSTEVLNMCVHFFDGITPEHLNTLFSVTLSGLLHQDMHNLTRHVLLNLALAITTFGQTIVEKGVIRLQN